MGNTVPLVSPPKPSPTRAVIYMEPQGIFGEFRIVNAIDDIPPALDGTVPADVYKQMIESTAERLALFRGGQVTIIVSLFQVFLLLACVLGFIASRYIMRFIFLNPVVLGSIGIAEICVILGSGRFVNRQEKKLVNDLLKQLRPWRNEYGVIANMRKFRGRCRASDKKKSSVFYCLVLEKIDPDVDHDTLSLSSFTDIDSDMEAVA